MNLTLQEQIVLQLESQLSDPTARKDSFQPNIPGIELQDMREALQSLMQEGYIEGKMYKNKQYTGVIDPILNLE
jgi:hypothetical protein